MRASRARHAQSGVTLMELLVAITLLSLLSVGMLFALRVGLNSMTKSNGRLMSNRRVIGVERVFRQQLAGYMPVKADCVVPQGGITSVVFFQGEEQTMRLVSSYSLQDATRGYPQILEYQVIPGENGAGVRLIVNEILYTGALSTGQLCAGVGPDVEGLPTGHFREVVAGPHSFVLADKLSSCRFFYKEELQQPPGAERWVPRWAKARPPAAIRVEMRPLDPNDGKLQIGAVTAPMRVNRDVFTRYNE